MSNAILFGSIGTIADTSELQRKAFNKAFEQHNLDWEWSQEEYRTLLESSGGQQRIEDYASSRGDVVEAAAVHKTKSELFQKFLDEETVEPRPGVTSLLEKAKAEGMNVALVTTTSAENVSSMLKALGKSLSTSDFDVVVNAADVSKTKPAKEAYCYALEQLNQKADSCIAIEDNVDGVEAAVAADIQCLAFPNQNTAHHDFGKAARKVDSLDLEQLKLLLAA
ncbi:MAG: HAD-IA family hydrolase [Cyanobacteria bacterium J06649_5]